MKNINRKKILKGMIQSKIIGLFLVFIGAIGVPNLLVSYLFIWRINTFFEDINTLSKVNSYLIILFIILVVIDFIVLVGIDCYCELNDNILSVYNGFADLANNVVSVIALYTASISVIYNNYDYSNSIETYNEYIKYNEKKYGIDIFFSDINGYTLEVGICILAFIIALKSYNFLRKCWGERNPLQEFLNKNNMKTTLVIMAAGIGSRFGGGIKQLAPVGLIGEIIMDYSIHDAIEAGFDKIVFIIRKDIEDAFKEAIGDRIEKICSNLDVEIAYAYQELSKLPEGVELPADRTKPWGTGHAVLACKEVLHEPFAVINADDYYGKEAFVKLHDFLVDYTPEKANQFCMAGFILKNTLSENGAVTRGICETNEEGYLTAVHETSNIVKTPEGAAVDNDGQLTSIDAESYASMNMWGLTPEFMQTLEDGFKEFFANMGDKDILKAEYLLPIYIDELLQAGRVSVKVLDTNDKWFGVTYKEDKDYVVKSFAKLIEDGVYQKNLFEDLK